MKDGFISQTVNQANEIQIKIQQLSLNLSVYFFGWKCIPFLLWTIKGSSLELVCLCLN